MLAIGLMSGTSLDGCDVALVEFNKKGEITLKSFQMIPYSEEFKSKLRKNLSLDTAILSDICGLNFELGYIFKESIDKLLQENHLNYSDIEFVSSHGQTIWHNPKGELGNVPSTLQIGEAQVISTLTGIKVVSNFRVADVVAGGEGAPLVPMFEYLYFKKEKKNIILQNIGGIGNLTYIKKNSDISEIMAFDTGPGNVMIDYFMNKYFCKPYDENGAIASKGMIIKSVLDYLMEDSYIKDIPPKSTGREKYSFMNLERIAEKLDFNKYDKEDIITTVTEYTIQTIIYSYNNFVKNYDKVIVSGGGAHNLYIMNRLREELKCEVVTAEEVGINSDAKEAMAFAMLGYLSLNGLAGNVQKATGAKYPLVLGQVTLAKRI